MMVEIAVSSCQSSMRRSTELNCPHAGHEKLSQGKPASTAAPIVGSAIALRSALAHSRCCAGRFGPMTAA